MRIGIYDPYFDDLGGGEKYMMTLAECLSKKHEVVLFWDSQKDIDELLRRFSLEVEKVKISKNIFATSVSFLERLRETKKYDVIIVLTDGSIPLSLSKKLFLHIQQPLPGNNLSSWKGLIKQARISGIFYNSQFTKSFNDKLFPKISATVIYPPVYWLQKTMKRENIILHVGRFRPKNVGVEDFKKQSVMIDAFAQMVDKKIIKNWKFVLATSMKEEDEEKFAKLKEAAKGYPIDLLINKNNSELWDVYNKAKIYWHASGFGEDLEKNPEFAEHFGISTVEAMGAGVVPVVINAGGQKEIVTDGENGFLWNTLTELQEKTKKVMDDEKLWNNLSKNAMEKAKDFSKEKFCEEVTKFITA
jgi:glycosyltransferase involved in cell wall biosynthesis